MSEIEDKYSSYRSYYSSMTTVTALLAGFTFTGITLLLTRLPDPTQTSVQATLLFLTVLLNLFLYSLAWAQTAIENCIRIAPELSQTWWRWNRARVMIGASSEYGLRFSVVLMFLIWNMTYLAMASALTLVLLIILEHRSIYKPYNEELKKKPWIRK
jgi:hypothetical protein